MTARCFRPFRPLLDGDGPRLPVLIPSYGLEPPEKVSQSKNDQPCRCARLHATITKDPGAVWGTARGLALLGEDGFLEDSKVQPSLDPPWDLKQEPKDQERTNEQTNKQITGAPVSQSGTMTRRGDISYNYGDPR